jgi:hypothetical protein
MALTCHKHNLLLARPEPLTEGLLIRRVHCMLLFTTGPLTRT